ncbi:MAG: DUF1836 domain-containing protein [Vallitalea sp.]|jgi:hypothetical protein|nr:DUF1836 domain-containing protein [Vallitalea sp.]
MNYEAYIKKVLEDIKSMDYVYSKDIPNINLYMDQVTTFMDDNLGSLKRREDDKILTKTMINNYSKNHILPPPIKKKYTNNHMIMLIFIYYFKHVLSITDIQKLLSPIKDMLDDDSFSLEEFYDSLLTIQKDEYKLFEDYVENTIRVATDSFKNTDIENKDMLELFSIVHLLTVQSTAQKYLAEKLIDEFFHKNIEQPKDIKKDNKQKK